MEDNSDQFVAAKLKSCLALAQDLASLLLQYSKAEDLQDTMNLREYLSGVHAIEEQLEEACVIKSAFVGKFSQEAIELLENTHEHLRFLTAKFTNLRDTNRLLRAVASVHLRKCLDEEMMSLQRNLVAVLRRLRRCKDIALLGSAPQNSSSSSNISHASLPVFNSKVRFSEARRNTAAAGLSVQTCYLLLANLFFEIPTAAEGQGRAASQLTWSYGLGDCQTARTKWSWQSTAPTSNAYY